LHNYKDNKKHQLALLIGQKATLNERFALKFMSSSHKVQNGILSATKVGTPPRKNLLTEFYVIGFIASGSTSKVFEAVTTDGNFCVIKM
jgi:hypothetical protein